MKEYDRVELIIEKQEYVKEGVHKGMDGWICDSRKIEGCWLVCFDNADWLKEYPIIPVKEEDLKIKTEN